MFPHILFLALAYEVPGEADGLCCQVLAQVGRVGLVEAAGAELLAAEGAEFFGEAVRVLIAQAGNLFVA